MDDILHNLIWNFFEKKKNDQVIAETFLKVL